MEDKLFNFLSDSTTLITHCPVCNLRYDPLEARILEESSSNHLVHITCRYCKASVLALIITSQMGVSSIGLITDLNSDEVSDFRKSGNVTTDDVIEIHQFLNRQRAFIDYLN